MDDLPTYNHFWFEMDDVGVVTTPNQTLPDPTWTNTRKTSTDFPPRSCMEVREVANLWQKWILIVGFWDVPLWGTSLKTAPASSDPTVEVCFVSLFKSWCDGSKENSLSKPELRELGGDSLTSWPRFGVTSAGKGRYNLPKWFVVLIFVAFPMKNPLIRFSALPVRLIQIK